MGSAGTPGGDRAPVATGPDAAPAASAAPAEPGTPVGADRSLRGAEAARAHVTLAIGLSLCTVAFWFEIRRALGGNGLSWAYVFEWPLFAVFAVYMWWNVLHGDRAVRRRRPDRPGPALDPRYAGMLEAWESHQRELRASQAAADEVPGSAAGGGAAGSEPSG